MYRLWYDVIVPRFAPHGGTVCLMTDTDSFLNLVPAESPDAALEQLSHVMDFSNYNPSHRLYDPSRKNAVGYLKSELPDDTITHFAGVRSKAYAFKTAKQCEEAKAKGVKRCYKKKLSFDVYKNCLAESSSVSVKQVNIISKDHQNLLIQSEKVAFSSFDDKRFLLCRIHSVPYGSKFIRYKRETDMCYFCQHPNILS